MNKEFAPDANREEKLKEEILDEAFKKAEISRGIRPLDKKPGKEPYEKTFPKLGILLIVFAIIGLVCIYQITWAYIKYDAGEKPVEALIYKDFVGENIENQYILDLFQSPYYAGLSIDDFTTVPTLASYGFVSLIILGVLITLFGVLDRMRNFSAETIVVTHFMFAAVTIIPSLFISLSALKFLGGNFILFYNMSLIPTLNNVVLFFPAAFVIIVLGFIVVRIAFTVLRMDFKEMQKAKEISESGQPSSEFIYRGESR